MIDTIAAVKNLLNGQGMVLQVFSVILVTAIIHYIQMVVFRRVKNKVEATKTNWDEAIINSINKPLAILIWFLGVSYALKMVQFQQGNAAILKVITPIRELAVIAIIVWFLIRLIKNLEWAYANPKGELTRKIDKTTINAVSQVLRGAVLVTAAIVALQTMGYNISGVLTLGSVGTLVAGFAAKDLLANFFGGLMVYFDRPFKVGDWIRSPDRSIEGTVEHIGWRLCRIRTFDKRPLYVPNSAFSTISVENPSRMLNRRIKTNVGVRYDDAAKIKDIVADVKAMLLQHPEIDTKATLIVNLVEFGPSSLNFMVYTFTKTTRWIKFQEIQQDVFLKIIDIISKHGAECAFPTSTIHIPDAIKLRNNPDQATVNSNSTETRVTENF